MIMEETENANVGGWGRNLFEEEPRFAVGLLDELRLKDATGFTNFTRLTPTDF